MIADRIIHMGGIHYCRLECVIYTQQPSLTAIPAVFPSCRWLAVAARETGK
jgi:hypothetical protein